MSVSAVLLIRPVSTDRDGEALTGQRFEHQVEHLHRLGPRVLAELLAEIAHDTGQTALIAGRVEAYARLNPEVVRFVVAQHGRMPDYLRWPIRLATAAFDLFGFARYGRRFHTQSHATRWRQIEVWRDGPFRPARDFIRFYESLILYRWYADHGQ